MRYNVTNVLEFRFKLLTFQSFDGITDLYGGVLQVVHNSMRSIYRCKDDVLYGDKENSHRKYS